MESYLRFSIVVLVCGLCLSGVATRPSNAAQMDAVGAAEENTLNLPAFPFLAEITGDDVYIRSGQGTQYYNTGKLRKGDKVKVVGNKFSWLQIVPPAGSYSWISKQYVQIDAQNNTSGTVIGDAVRVYAGSDEVQPMHSTSMQVKLNKSDKVTIVGEEKDGYCKIAPPEGAYLWVSSQHAKPLGTMMAPTPAAPAITATPSTMPATAHPVPAAPFPTNPGSLKPQGASANEPNEPNMPSPAPAPMTLEEQRMVQVQMLKGKIEAERAKPAAAQNFTDIKKELMDVAGDKQNLRAARNAQNLLKMVEKCELSQDVAKALQAQEEQFGKTQQQIDSAKNEQLSKLEDKSVFAVIGKLLESPLFAEMPSARYYRMVDENGKTLCYARPVGAAADVDLSKFLDKKVGLVGAIEANAEMGEAVVRFTNIVEIP